MRNRALKFTLGFGIVGLVVMILVTVVQRGAINAYHNNLPYVRLSDQLKKPGGTVKPLGGARKTSRLKIEF